MAIIFDPAAKRIILDSASVTATDLYSRSADWMALSDNAKYGSVFLQVGGDDLGGGLSIPPYFFLQGAWRVRPMEANHDLTITGNLFVEGGGVPVVRTIGTYQVNVNYTVPVAAQGISTSGGSAPTVEQISAAVWQRILENGMSAEAMQRVVLAALVGQTAGIGSATEIYKAQDGATPRITANFDGSNNRTSVTLNGA